MSGVKIGNYISELNKIIFGLIHYYWFVPRDQYYHFDKRIPMRDLANLLRKWQQKYPGSSHRIITEVFKNFKFSIDNKNSRITASVLTMLIKPNANLSNLVDNIIVMGDPRFKF